MIPILEIGPVATSALLAAAGVICFGSFVQGVTGFGMGLVAVPFLAFLMPERLPQIVLALMIPATMWHLVVERHSLRAQPIAWALTGRVAGTLPGVLVVTLLSERGLQITFGSLTLIAVLFMLRSGVNMRQTWGTQLGMGVLSGIMATSAGVGGPPLVMLFADRPGSETRAFISGVALPGTLVSLAGLALAGRFSLTDLAVSFFLIFPLLLGLVLSRFAVRWVDRDRFRTTVLLVVAGTAVLLIGRGLLSLAWPGA